MIGEFLSAIVSWKTFVVSLLVFGFAPGAVLRVLVLAFHRDDPRRSEMLAELYRVPRLERPYWVFEQLERALAEGVYERLLWAGAGRLYDRWHLTSGVRQNRKHPETFQIPDEEEKQAIEPGVLVKLVFATTDLWGRPNWGERMWVEVVAIEKRHIVGVLRNQPFGIPRLYAGDQVTFKRDHIIDINWEPDDFCDCQHGPESFQPLHAECNRPSEAPAEDPGPPLPPQQ
jgi:Uncharacterized protein conserved in bacteria (DUF2314)